MIVWLTTIVLNLESLPILHLANPRIVNASDTTQISSLNDVDYLIITSELFNDDVQPLAIWKLQRGLIPAIKTVENISSTYEGEDEAECIKKCIQDFHENRNTQWVVLAGGRSHVPTRSVRVESAQAPGTYDYVSCDHYYANLDDNWENNIDGIVSIIDYFDWDAEVYVGRLPADNNDQMRELVNRLINYERNPPVGSWMTRALFGGAFARFDSDDNDNNIFDEEDTAEFDANRNHNWLKTNIFPSDWTSVLLGETEGLKTTDFYVDRPLNEFNIIEEINNGVSTGMFDSHGSTTSMFRMIFTNDEDNDSLFDYGNDGYSNELLIDTTSEIDTEGKYGFFFLCACSTGTFARPGDCLSEYILRTAGIGCIASSGSAYYDSGWYNGEHGGWFTQGLSSRFWEQFFTVGGNQPGKAFIRAKIDYIDDFLRLNGREESSNKTLIQYNLMGDPEVPVWTIIPSQLECSISNESTSTIIATFSNDQTISHVTVTLLNSTYYWRGTTNKEGTITLPISSNELTNVTLTISKINFLPWQYGLENTPESISELSQDNNEESIIITSSSNHSTSDISTSFPEFSAILITGLILAIQKKKRKIK
ncbi:MAG: C25 family cysteine peptidase [Candidatus Hermodarchaeota archaeon]